MHTDDNMNGWKVAAIILAIIVILETSLIGFAYSLATDEEEKDTQCAVNVCSTPDDLYDGYNYELDYCYCFKNGEVAKTTYIGD